MKLGCFLPQMGPSASPEAMVKVAQHAEKLGFGSVVQLVHYAVRNHMVDP